ncbi:MAG: zf-HC2 domain-containing protein [Bryobacteraceae bacterium]
MVKLRTIRCCPDDPHGNAEDYLLHRLPANQSEAFERHLTACEACLRVLVEERAIIRAFKAAAANMGLSNR